jgi:hypothetical protein
VLSKGVTFKQSFIKMGYFVQGLKEGTHRTHRVVTSQAFSLSLRKDIRLNNLYTPIIINREFIIIYRKP